MAAKGQLNEDLAIAAIGKAAGGGPPAQLIATIKKAVRLYAEHGFTLTQEGSASFGQALLYDLATSDPQWPVTSALLIYDPNTADPTSMSPRPNCCATV